VFLKWKAVLLAINGIIHDRPVNTSKPMEIPWQSVAPDVLHKLLEELVSRDGTDYGVTEKTQAQKIAEVTEALRSGQAKLYWDADSETASIERVLQ